MKALVGTFNQEKALHSFEIFTKLCLNLYGGPRQIGQEMQILHLNKLKTIMSIDGGREIGELYVFMIKIKYLLFSSEVKIFLINK